MSISICLHEIYQVSIYKSLASVTCSCVHYLSPASFLLYFSKQRHWSNDGIFYHYEIPRNVILLSKILICFNGFLFDRALKVCTLLTHPKLWDQISWEMLEHTWPTFKNTPNAQYWTSSSCILLLLSIFFFLVLLLHLWWSSFKNPDFKEKGIHPVILEDVTILPSCIFTMENIVRQHMILLMKPFLIVMESNFHTFMS